MPYRYEEKFEHIENAKRRKILGMINLLDESILNITRDLERNNMLEHTLIIFTSDVSPLSIICTANPRQMNKASTHLERRRNTGLPAQLPFERRQNDRFRRRTASAGIHLRQRPEHSGAVHLRRPLPLGRLAAHYHQCCTRYPNTWVWSPCGALKSHKLTLLLLDGTDIDGIDGINQWDSILNNKPSNRSSFIYTIDPLGARRDFNYRCNTSTEAIRWFCGWREGPASTS